MINNNSPRPSRGGARRAAHVPGATSGGVPRRRRRPPPRWRARSARAELQARRTEGHLSFTHKSGVGLRLRRGAAPRTRRPPKTRPRRGRAPRRRPGRRAPCTSPSGTGSTPRKARARCSRRGSWSTTSSWTARWCWKRWWIRKLARNTPHTMTPRRRWEGGPDRWKVTARRRPRGARVSVRDARHPCSRYVFGSRQLDARAARRRSRADGFFPRGVRHRSDTTASSVRA